MTKIDKSFVDIFKLLFRRFAMCNIKDEKIATIHIKSMKTIFRIKFYNMTARYISLMLLL